MPLSARRGKEATAASAAIVHANAPHSESGRRPYLLKMLQHHIGGYLLADTLDWDGEFFIFVFFVLSFPPWFKSCCCRGGGVGA